MEKIPSAQELAQKALELLNITDKLEEERNWGKAIENYQQAAEFLKQSGYLPHRVTDIYNRIAEIKNFIAKEKFYQRQTTQTQIEQFQNQAFALLDGAQRLENEGFFQDAIQQYMSAIKILVEAGWSENQLENLKTKIIALTQNVERQKLVKEQREKKHSNQTVQIPNDSRSYPKIIEPTKLDIDKKSERLKEYETKRRQEDQIQNKAFEYIDEAKIFEKERKFDNAINNYQEAIKLLNSIGWESQTRNLQLLIQNLKKDKENFERVEAIRKQQAKESIQSLQTTIPIDSDSKEELRKRKLREFEIRRKQEEEIQTKAFNLIDYGKKLEREKNYEKAITQFQNAIELLKSISWDSYIQPIYNLINDIKVKENREREAKQVKKRRQDELNHLQRTIYEKQKENVIQKVQKFQTRKMDFEQEKLKQVQKEEQFFNILDDANKILQKEGNYDKAISLYYQAKRILSERKGWDSEINKLEDLIKNLQQEKANIIQKQRNEAQLQLKRQQEFESFKEEMNRIRLDHLKQLEDQRLKLKQFEEKKEFDQKLRKEGLKLIDEGKRSAELKEFEKAYQIFKKAISHFREIGWNDQIHYIETEIKNTKNLEEYFKKEQLDRKRLKDEIDEQRKIELERWKQEDLKKKKTIGEVGTLTDQVSNLIRAKEKEFKSIEDQKNVQLKIEAKEYSKNMGKILRIKQELLSELKKEEEKTKKREDEIQKAKDKKEVDEIAKMLRDIKNKKK